MADVFFSGGERNKLLRDAGRVWGFGGLCKRVGAGGVYFLMGKVVLVEIARGRLSILSPSG